MINKSLKRFTHHSRASTPPRPVRHDDHLAPFAALAGGMKFPPSLRCFKFQFVHVVTYSYHMISGLVPEIQPKHNRASSGLDTCSLHTHQAVCLCPRSLHSVRSYTTHAPEILVPWTLVPEIQPKHNAENSGLDACSLHAHQAVSKFLCRAFDLTRRTHLKCCIACRVCDAQEPCVIDLFSEYILFFILLET